MKLLLVDDNPAMRRVMRAVVAEAADTVVECGDGAEVLAVYAAHHFSGADWVLMDVRMTTVGGLQATAQLKARFPEARVVIVTNYDDLELRAAARAAGACAYVLKDNLGEIRRLLQSTEAQT